MHQSSVSAALAGTLVFAVIGCADSGTDPSDDEGTAVGPASGAPSASGTLTAEGLEQPAMPNGASIPIPEPSNTNAGATPGGSGGVADIASGDPTSSASGGSGGDTTTAGPESLSGMGGADADLPGMSGGSGQGGSGGTAMSPDAEMPETGEPEAPDEMNEPEEMEPEPETETFGPDIDGPCTESQPASSNASGSGPYDVVVETNSDAGINEGTIFRPSELGGAEKFPIFVWGEGGCSQNGLSNAAAMGEIASHGYFVVADGTPNGNGSRSMNSNDVPSMGEPLLAYIDWAIAENSKPCSAYYHSLDASKVSANGFSCGGLMATGTAGDPRITTWGSTSSGTFSPNQALYDSVHTPVLIVEGGPSDIAYENGLRDYENISALGHPIMFFSKDIGHGGDLFQGGSGDFTKINLAWLNWWLKGDESETGKGVLVGASCSYCTDSEWEVMSENIP